MAGKRHSKRDQHHLDQAMYHITQVGGALPKDKEAKAASLNDRIDAVWQALTAAMLPLDTWPCVEDIYDDYVVVGVEGTCYRADYTVDEAGAVTLAPRADWYVVEAVWQPIGAAAGAKAGLLLGASDSTGPLTTMKAVGDRLIEVKVAYYGHKGGRDSHGEYFSPNTDFDTENFPAPPLLYYHGYDAGGKKMGKPAVTGVFVSRKDGTDGHLLTYKLKRTRYADLQWDAAQKNACVVSPGTIGHLIRKAADGELLYWPLAEVSAWDYAPNRAPANLHSVAAPVLKAAYLEAGLSLPPIVETGPPEAPGDGASASDIDPKLAEQAIAQSVADMLINLRKG